MTPPIDVYDAAEWSAMSRVNKISIARGSSLIEILDFTCGKWKTNKRIIEINDAF